MKRPFAAAGFTGLIVMLGIIYIENTVVVLCLFILSVIGVIVSLSFKKLKALPFVVILIGTGLACFLFLRAEYQRTNDLSLCGKNVSVEAVVTSEPEFRSENKRWYAVARLKTITHNKAYGKIRISFSESKDGIDAQSLLIGDRLSFNATVYKIGDYSKESHLHFCAEGIYTGAHTLKDLKITKPEMRNLFYYVSKIRNYVKNTVKHSFNSETAGLIIAVLTGEKNDISDRLYYNFKKSGAVHIIAVSGMHLSVWVVAIDLLLKRYRRIRTACNIILCFSIVFIMMFAHFSPSVMRAGAMALLSVSGRFVSRRSDGFNSLGFAATVLMILNPYIAVSEGFLLSFLSVLSIYLIAVPAYDCLEKNLIYKIPSPVLKSICSVFITSVCISVSVSAFTFPVMAEFFGSFSLISPVTNFLLFYAVTPFMILSGLFSVLHFIPVVSPVIKLLLEILAFYIKGVVNTMSAVPFSTVPANRTDIWLWAVVMGIAVFLLYCIIKKKTNFSAPYAVGATVAALLLIFNLSTVNTNSYKITPIITHDGISYLVSMNSKGVLVGVSDSYGFENELKGTVESLGTEICAAVYFDSTKEYEASYICNSFGISNIIRNEGESVTLYGRVKITKENGFVSVTGNGRTVHIFEKEYLHYQNKCDIILDNYGLVFCESYDEPENMFNYSVSSDDFSVSVNEDGEYTLGGWNIGGF